MRPLILLVALSCSAPLWAALVVTPYPLAVQAPYYYTGDGNGFSLGGYFEVSSSNGLGHVLYSITLTANGTADDSTAYSEFGLFVDSNGNAMYDPGVDTRYGPTYQAFPADNGTLTFTENVSIPSIGSTRFLIVAKLDGQVLLYDNDDSGISVTSVSGTGGVASGVPTATCAGVTCMNGPTPLMLEYKVSASGPPYTYDFRLVNDNHNGTWVAGQEWSSVIFGLSSFGVGGAPFTVWMTNSASYPIGPFINTNWAMGSMAGVVYSGPILTSSGSATWAPGFVGDELVWSGTVNTFLNEGEMTWVSWRTMAPTGEAKLEPARRVGDYLRVVAASSSAVDVGPTATGSGTGFVIGAFDVASHTNAATLSSITVGASGSGDDSNAFSSIRLFVDSNSSGAYDPGVDAQFGQSYSAYPADNGSLTFIDTLNFSPDETKRLLVVVMLNGPTLATYGQTFNTTVTAISATGNMHSGLPTAAMPGIHIQAPTLTLATTGAGLSVHNAANGPGGIGAQAGEFTLANNSVGVANLNSISIKAAGSIFDHTAFSYVALFEDTNASGMLDAGDALYATAASGFPNDDGTLTFNQAMVFAPGQTRRFFVAVKLNGTAQAGDDFWVQISALGVTGGTETSGVPGELVNGLLIVANQPQIAVSRDAAPVANGSTDDLPTTLGGIALSLTYTITNNGTVALDLTGTPSVTVTPGAYVSGLSVVTPPAATIAPGGSATFTLTYVSSGAFDFVVSIESSDPGNNPYTWTVTGSIAAPGGDSGGGNDGGCSTGDRGTWMLWLLLAIPAVLLIRRRMLI